MSSNKLETGAPAWPSYGGESGTLIRTFDWTKTPLGPIGRWPHHLRILVELMLASRQPACITWNAEHTLLYNDGYSSILGSRHPEALGLPVFEVWHDIDPAVGLLVETAYSGEASAADDIWVTINRHGYAEEAHFAFSLTPVRGDAGAVIGTFCICTEMTGKVLAEWAQRESEARLNVVTSLLDIGWYTWWPASGELDWDDRMKALWGLPPDAEIDAAGALAAIHPDDQAVVKSVMAEFADPSPGRVYHLEYRVIGADAVERWVATRARALQHDGRAGFVGVARDITQEKHAEAALRVSEARNRFLLALDDSLRGLDDPHEIMTEAAERLGRHLGAGRAGYGEVDAAAAFVTVHDDWTDGTMPSFAGRHRLDDFGPQIIDELRAGRAIRLDDVLADPRTAGASIKAGFAAIGMRSGLSVPFMDGGQLVATLYVHGATSRHWRNDELTLLQEVVERTWEAVGRARAERALQESEHRQRALIESIPQLVWRALEGGHATWTNPQWTAYTGLSAEMTLERGWLEALHPDDRAGALDAWPGALATGVYEGEHRIFNAAKGQYCWFRTHAKAVRDPDENVVEWIGVSTEIDDQVHAREVLARNRDALEVLVAARTAELAESQQRLAQAQKMEALGQLTGGIAHDFNNMLHGIVGGLELAQRRMAAGQPAGAVRFMEMARTSADRATALTQRLLAFGRQRALDAQPLSVDALLGGLVELIRRTVGSQIEVDLRLKDSAWTVLCDPNLLESAVLNLVINARDAMAGAGRLIISAQDVFLNAVDLIGDDGVPPGSFVELAVADTGDGMTPEVRARVFDPFFTTKPIGQGTGLGLSQVYSFVRQSGGVIRVESEPGQGTTVRLFLPRCYDEVATTAAAPVAAPAPGPVTPERITVLVVDDEAAVREMTADALCEFGYAVLEAEDDVAALEVLQSAVPLDLLITDIGLPGRLDGRELADAAREVRPTLPVLFITGNAGSIPERQLGRGMKVIAKPFTLDTLAAQVWSLLGPVVGPDIARSQEN